MKEGLLMNELLFLVISTIGVVLAWAFYRSKNGILRKLMIWYFCVDVYVYLSSAIYFWLAETGYPVITLLAFRFLVLIPKAIMNLRILYYLRTKK